jgi:hypothetical protein
MCGSGVPPGPARYEPRMDRTLAVLLIRKRPSSSRPLAAANGHACALRSAMRLVRPAVLRLPTRLSRPEVLRR